MSLRDVPLKRRYRGNEDDILADLYLPCLSEATNYRRAVGYFSASALALAARGLTPFVRRGGHVRLIASPDLTGVDPEMMSDAYEKREQMLGETLSGTLVAGARPGPTRQRLGLLGWLVAHDRLDLKIAVVASETQNGIYHEKFGVFEDEDGNRVAFHGSANESRGALVANFESVMTFRSWADEEANDVAEFDRDFEELWNDRTAGLRVFDFPEATRRQLVEFSPDDPPDQEPAEPPLPNAPVTSARNSRNSTKPGADENEVELRPYQRDALRNWFANDARGILEMATGTGKTLTALAGVQRLREASRKHQAPLLVIVVCPYQHLVTQWSDAARRLGMAPVLCYRSRHEWSARLTSMQQALNQGALDFGIAIATNATFQSPAFQSALAHLPRHGLLIADEVHNLGARGLREALPEQMPYRMGLSATPERFMDLEGTAAIEEYFGSVVFAFGLREAIEIGALTPYDYAISVVELMDEELERYVELTRAIARSISPGGPEQAVHDERTKHLLIARARVVANAAGKIPALRDAIEPHRQDSHTLVYCGDGSASDDTGAEATRQIEAAVKLLGLNLGMRVQPYTAETAIDDRSNFRDRFAAGDLQALVAIRCLDEGVDIPATERAFILASSSNPRQFVQRRGRVLRPSPQTGKKVALIHDFLAIPPEDAMDDETEATERRLVGRELARVVQFAELARNGPQAVETLSALRDRYNLLHL